MTGLSRPYNAALSLYFYIHTHSTRNLHPLSRLELYVASLISLLSRSSNQFLLHNSKACESTGSDITRELGLTSRQRPTLSHGPHEASHTNRRIDRLTTVYGYAESLRRPRRSIVVIVVIESHC